MLAWLKRFFRRSNRTEVSSTTPSIPTPVPVEVNGSLPEIQLELEIEPIVTTQEEVVQLDEELNDEPSLDKQIFYNSLRTSLFRSGLNTTQVKGIDALLKDMNGRPASWIAYALSTAFHETNRNMKPNTENLNYSVQGLLNTFGRHRISEADARRLGRKPGEGPLPVARQREIGNILYGGDWGRTNLGNTEPNDGWNFRGRGMDHCTGRRNYRVTGQDIGIDLLANPEALLVLENAVKALHLGMVTGRYAGDRNGRHTFARHLPAKGNATRQQFSSARRIINGIDKADLLAGYALDFQKALNDAGYKG